MMNRLSKQLWLVLMNGRGRKKGAAATSADDGSTIGVLTFEVSSLMAKAVHLWRSLSHEQICRLRDQAIRLQGVRKLVSDDDDFLLGLALTETMDSVDSLARSVALLGKRCADPFLRRFHHAFADLITNGSDPCGLAYSPTKMSRCVKKMEGFVSAAADLYQELDILAELEQGMRRMQANPDARARLDFAQKVASQRQEVKFLRDVSVWNRSFGYASRLLARALFTIVVRIKLVFGFQQGTSQLSRSCSYSVSRDIAVLSRISGRKFSAHAGLADGNASTRIKCLVSSDSFRGCLASRDEDAQSEIPFSIFDSNLLLAIFKSKRKLLNAPPSTLGASALALHYANVIALIEKLAASPHLIGRDARDDLYGLLPGSIRAALRTRLKSCAKSLAVSVFDPELAADWSDAMTSILEWLAPLAHNMIKWQSDRNFEQQQHWGAACISVRLLQTLHYANQAKTEAAVTELLVGLDYLWRYAKEASGSKK